MQMDKDVDFKIFIRNTLKKSPLYPNLSNLETQCVFSFQQTPTVIVFIGKSILSSRRKAFCKQLCFILLILQYISSHYEVLLALDTNDIFVVSFLSSCSLKCFGRIEEQLKNGAYCYLRSPNAFQCKFKGAKKIETALASNYESAHFLSNKVTLLCFSHNKFFFTYLQSLICEVYVG